MRYKELCRMASSLRCSIFWEPTLGEICLILFLGLGGKQDDLSQPAGAAPASSNSGLRANIFSAVAKRKIPRGLRRRRRTNASHTTPGSDRTPRRHTTRESHARFAVGQLRREYLIYWKSPSIATCGRGPRGRNVWAFMQNGFTFPD
jgi:hypothetical protein